MLDIGDHEAKGIAGRARNPTDDLRKYQAKSVEWEVTTEKPPMPLPHLRGRSGFLSAEEHAAVVVPFKPGRITGPVKLLSKLLERWELDFETACAILGFDKSEKKFVEGLLAGVNTLRGRDLKDRIANLTEIYRGLYALFRNPDAEKAWLREPQEMLGGASAGITLAEGSMEGLITVRQLVQHLCGR